MKLLPWHVVVVSDCNHEERWIEQWCGAYTSLEHATNYAAGLQAGYPTAAVTVVEVEG